MSGVKYLTDVAEETESYNTDVRAWPDHIIGFSILYKDGELQCCTNLLQRMYAQYMVLKPILYFFFKPML